MGVGGACPLSVAGPGTEPWVPSACWASRSGEGAVSLKTLLCALAVSLFSPEASHDQGGGRAGRCPWGEGQMQRLLSEGHVLGEASRQEGGGRRAQ